MLELEVEAHIVHLLEDVIILGVRLDWQTAASTDGKSLGTSVTTASHRAMLMHPVTISNRTHLPLRHEVAPCECAGLPPQLCPAAPGQGSRGG